MESCFLENSLQRGSHGFVARVEAGMLSILIDRYDTNEPVLDATVEVESGPLRSKAVFRRESGDYAITSAELLKRLAEPGSHPLVFVSPPSWQIGRYSRQDDKMFVPGAEISGYVSGCPANPRELEASTALSRAPVSPSL